MKRFIIMGAIAISLSGCFEKGATDEGLAKAISAASDMEIANNSPDVTVKSWWRVKDASTAVNFEICKNNLKLAASYFDKLSQLSADGLYQGNSCEQRAPIFNRQITNVDVQSDTRAVVAALIKNATPPEEGAVLDDEAKKAKEAGVRFQYVLERKDANSDWKISKVASFPSYARDWEDVYVKPEPSNHRYVYDFYQ